MKRVISFLLCFVFLFCLCACTLLSDSKKYLVYGKEALSQSDEFLNGKISKSDCVSKLEEIETQLNALNAAEHQNDGNSNPEVNTEILTIRQSVISLEKRISRYSGTQDDLENILEARNLLADLLQIRKKAITDYNTTVSQGNSAGKGNSSGTGTSSLSESDSNSSGTDKSSSSSVQTSAATPTPVPKATEKPVPTPTSKPATPTSKPATPTPTPTPAVSQGKTNALKSAKSYLNISAFSYDGLVDQLEYEQYSHEEAVYAADHCGANWNEQALKNAQSYLNISAFSYSGLIEQLEYEKYTSAQASYGADHCGANWNEQAAKSAASYLKLMSFSRQSLIDQLEYKGFTHDQAVYGVEANGF